MRSFRFCILGVLAVGLTALGACADPKATDSDGIGGTDGDADGVRDDVDRAILDRYGADAAVAALQRQGARAVEATLRAGADGDPAAAAAASDATFLWTTCMVALETERGLPWGWAEAETTWLGQQLRDTPARAAAAAAYEALRDGTVAAAPSPNGCAGA